MKHILTGFSLISAWALLALAVGCASTSTQTQSEQDLLIAAGFKVVMPKTTVQQQKLQSLPPGQLAMITKGARLTTCFPTRLTTGRWWAGLSSTRATSSTDWPSIYPPNSWQRRRRTRMLP
jgi:hypothetical protein